MSAYWQTMVRSAFAPRDHHRPQTREEMRAAVHELRSRGMTDYGIAHATLSSAKMSLRAHWLSSAKIHLCDHGYKRVFMVQTTPHGLPANRDTLGQTMS